MAIASSERRRENRECFSARTYQALGLLTVFSTAAVTGAAYCALFFGGWTPMLAGLTAGSACGFLFAGFRRA